MYYCIIQGIKAGNKFLESERNFSLQGNEMIIEQTVNGVSGKRCFKKE